MWWIIPWVGERWVGNLVDKIGDLFGQQLLMRRGDEGGLGRLWDTLLKVWPILSGAKNLKYVEGKLGDLLMELIFACCDAMLLLDEFEIWAALPSSSVSAESLPPRKKRGVPFSTTIKSLLFISHDAIRVRQAQTRIDGLVAAIIEVHSLSEVADDMGKRWPRSTAFMFGCRTIGRSSELNEIMLSLGVENGFSNGGDASALIFGGGVGKISTQGHEDFWLMGRILIEYYFMASEIWEEGYEVRLLRQGLKKRNDLAKTNEELCRLAEEADKLLAVFKRLVEELDGIESGELPRLIVVRPLELLVSGLEVEGAACP